MAPTRATAKSSCGDKLTDEVVEALADEAERGYDLEAAKRVRAGRPSLCRWRWRALPTSQRPRPRGDVRRSTSPGRRGVATVSDLAREALAEYVGRPRR